MGFFRLPCGRCDMKMDCLEDEQPCLRELYTVMEGLQALTEAIPAMIPILIGITGIAVSLAIFFLYYFKWISVKILMVSIDVLIFGCLLLVFSCLAEDHVKSKWKRRKEALKNGANRKKNS